MSAQPVPPKCTGWADTAVYDRDRLRSGHTFDGPAVIEQLDSTTLVPPGSRAEVDEWRNIRIQIGGAR